MNGRARDLRGGPSRREAGYVAYLPWYALLPEYHSAQVRVETPHGAPIAATFGATAVIEARRIARSHRGSRIVRTVASAKGALLHREVAVVGGE